MRFKERYRINGGVAEPNVEALAARQRDRGFGALDPAEPPRSLFPNFGEQGAVAAADVEHSAIVRYGSGSFYNGRQYDAVVPSRKNAGISVIQRFRRRHRFSSSAWCSACA